jgi:hypothetical protein
MTQKLLDLSPIEFKTILISHGWFDLAPFNMANDRSSLSLAFIVPQGYGHFRVYVENNRCFVDIISGTENLALSVAQRCFSLDIDVSGLYTAIVDNPQYDWITEKKFGRYLRSPTLFEDCFKIMATANTNWSNTKSIIQKTIDNFGPTVNGTKVFPEPNQLHQVSEDDFKSETKCGYRAGWFIDLYHRALNNPDLYLGDAWEQMTAEDFKNELIQIKGLGETCASYLGRFYGKPLNYTIDSWITKRCDELWSLNFRKTNKKGKTKPDLKRYTEWAKSNYDIYAPHGPSIFWFEISKFWHEKDGFSEKWWE